ncbi:glycerophosphodiester phosphodiesterase [Woeseiaceae bacterium]|nr:glycerophosphodiester phosphodiesterase [Woeseiaceae bacterium]
MTIVIAHRGASGYLPEHTLSAAALAYGMGADFIEQDIVLSKDDCPIVLHDIHLDQVTNVAEIFPQRNRDDGHWYVRDFELLELKQLEVHERANSDGSGPVFPQRFPYQRGHFQIPTLQEEIDLIQGLNHSTGRKVGIYTEIKKPDWHNKEGAEITLHTLNVLKQNNYEVESDNIFLQCFDSMELKRIKNDFKSKLPLIQLIGKNSWNESPDDFRKMSTNLGCKDIAQYAVGIGPTMDLFYTASIVNNSVSSTNLMQFAKNHNLLVHPFTFRSDGVPLAFGSYAEMVNWFVSDLKVDGLFTDFVDQTISLINTN